MLAGEGGEDTGVPGGAADDSKPQFSTEQLKRGEEQAKLAPEGELRSLRGATLPPLKAPQAFGGIEDEDNYDEE